MFVVKKRLLKGDVEISSRSEVEGGRAGNDVTKLWAATAGLGGEATDSAPLLLEQTGGWRNQVR
jgi:hypothetical protein